MVKFLRQLDPIKCPYLRHKGPFCFTNQQLRRYQKGFCTKNCYVFFLVKPRHNGAKSMNCKEKIEQALADGPMHVKPLAQKIGVSEGTVRVVLSRMLQRNEVYRTKNRKYGSLCSSVPVKALQALKTLGAATATTVAIAIGQPAARNRVLTALKRLALQNSPSVFEHPDAGLSNGQVTALLAHQVLLVAGDSRSVSTLAKRSGLGKDMNRALDYLEEQGLIKSGDGIGKVFFELTEKGKALQAALELEKLLS